MANKPLSDEACRGRLKKWIKDSYCDFTQEYMEFYPDEWDGESYKFVYELRDYPDEIFGLTINRMTGEITEGTEFYSGK